MVDTAQSIHLVRRERLPITGVFASTFRVFGKAPLTFLLFGLSSQLVALGRLIVRPPATPDFNVAAVVVLAGTLLLAFLLQTAVTYMAVRLHDGQPAAPGDALALGVRRYLPMLGTTLLYLLATYLGLVLLIVPGIVAATIFAVAVQVCVADGRGPIASLKRSAALTKGERWRILGIYCLFFIPLMILSGILAVASSMRGHFVLGQWINVLIQVVWFPLATIFSTGIYAELRRLKENVGVASIFD